MLCIFHVGHICEWDQQSVRWVCLSLVHLYPTVTSVHAVRNIWKVISMALLLCCSSISCPSPYPLLPVKEVSLPSQLYHPCNWECRAILRGWGGMDQIGVINILSLWKYFESIKTILTNLWMCSFAAAEIFCAHINCTGQKFCSYRNILCMHY